MSKPFRPMLSAGIETEEDFEKLEYPLCGSPKIDGIRVVCHPGLGPVTRSLKPIPNAYIREKLSHSMFKYMDGEIVVGSPTDPAVFNRTQSAVMSFDGQPEFKYIAFDHIASLGLNCPYSLRHEETAQLVANAKQVLKTRGESDECIAFLPHVSILTRAQLLDFEMIMLASGYEGVMLRHPQGKYKQGRSTLREQHLVKLKRFQDGEAYIIGVKPLQRNENEAYLDNLGLQKRSAHQENKVVDPDRVGIIEVVGLGGLWHDTGFEIGSGFTDAQRVQLMQDYREGKLLRRIVSYKYLQHGSKVRPRHPIFKGFRDD